MMSFFFFFFFIFKDVFVIRSSVVTFLFYIFVSVFGIEMLFIYTWLFYFSTSCCSFKKFSTFNTGK